jgi:hypothetical protein
MKQNLKNNSTFQFPAQEPEVTNRWICDDWCDLSCSPEELWPWLAQMGNGRAGWYSYDWLDNRGRKSFVTLDPNFVQIHKGQRIPFATIEDFKINEFLTYRFGKRASASYLIEKTATGIRLWTRVRVDGIGKIAQFFLKVGHQFMQRKQFREIKKRVDSI